MVIHERRLCLVSKRSLHERAHWRGISIHNDDNAKFSVLRSPKLFDKQIIGRREKSNTFLISPVQRFPAHSHTRPTTLSGYIRSNAGKTPLYTTILTKKKESNGYQIAFALSELGVCYTMMAWKVHIIIRTARTMVWHSVRIFFASCTLLCKAHNILTQSTSLSGS